jgi:hypothetical protein
LTGHNLGVASMTYFFGAILFEIGRPWASSRLAFDRMVPSRRITVSSFEPIEITRGWAHL